MDASTIIYIVLGLGALILQGYMEKKKKEQARLRREDEYHDDINQDLHKEPSLQDIFPSLPNLFASASEQHIPVEEEESVEIEVPAKRAEYKMIDIPVTGETAGEEITGEGISSFKHENNVARELSEETSDEPSIIIDPRNLVIYSEIMTPKFRE
jgi:hypothetical protein